MSEFVDHLNRGFAALDAGRLDEAEAAARQALAIDHGSVHGHFILDQVKRARDSANDAPPPAEAPPETAADAFEAVAKLHQVRAKPPAEDDALVTWLMQRCLDGTVTMEVGKRLIQHPHSPASVTAYDSQVIIGALVMGCGAWLLHSGTAGLAVFGGVIAVYLIFLRGWQQRRIVRFLANGFMKDFGKWYAAWNFGSITLIDTATGDRCEAPAGNWRDFTRAIQDRISATDQPAN
jgi:hypothetical protein